MLFNVPPRMLKHCAMGGPWPTVCVPCSSITACPSSGPPWRRRLRSALSASTGRAGCWRRVRCSASPHHPHDPRQLCSFKAMIAIVELNISGVTMELIQSAVENGLKAIL